MASYSRSREIDLLGETPFVVGRLSVRPRTLEIEGPEGKVTVEPRVMSVLIALYRARGETLSRDEMNAVCWMGRVVSLDAQTQAVARLRKVLAQDPTVEIETVSKIGYRLRVTHEERRSADLKLDRPAAARPGLRRFPLWASAAVGASAAAAAFAVIWMVSGFAPAPRVSQEDRAEVALSPDGMMRAFASAPRGSAQRDIYLHVMATGLPVRLTRTDADEYGPVWSPSGDRLAFVRKTADDDCLILTALVQDRSERVVGRCMAAATTRLTWADGDTLISSDRAEKSGVRRIVVLDVRQHEGADAFQLAALNRQSIKPSI
ncbi:winged helix-turn-helix domain-containing protein [Caulobacter sp. NIBR2454]|uniref:winged helix-turn-helix domain-containing protein n=1 Tax=Caulobacter sp. NIBR2454 TaxID=3015996 RepID=UPI0022B74293|nr:winged helix-turn-helix domain-containing protein [Caulobacter sp. NIBR2454]